MRGQVVDTESAREFMREALAQISELELRAIAGELEAKHQRFRSLLARPQELTPQTLRPLLRSVFSTRRRVDELLEGPAAPSLAGWIAGLLGTEEPVERRLQAFCEGLAGLPEPVRHDLASELLHYTAPERYWLWTRWMWDPRTRTGALPLVTMEDCDLDGGSPGETYLRVGRAVAFVNETGRAAGLTCIGDGAFGVDVYLACVYGVYVFTAVRMRMTREFNRVIPSLPELCRRFLGVYKMEV